MALIWHLIVKDARRLRALLVVWGVLVFLQLACGLALPYATSAATGRALYLAWGALPLLQALLLLVLVPLLIQEDPPVGSRAFWLTRPVGMKLLWAKLSFVALLLVAPHLVVNLVVLIANGLTPADAPAAVAELLLSPWPMVVAAAVLAALTGTFVRYALAALAFAVLQAVVGFLLAVPLAGVRRLLWGAMLAPQSLQWSRATAADLATVALAVALLACQYRWRRTGFTVVAAALVLATVEGLTFLWPLDFLRASPPPMPAPGSEPDRVTVQVAGSSLRSPALSLAGRGGRGERRVAVTLRWSDLPQGAFARVEAASTSIADRAGRVLRRERSETPTLSFADQEPSGAESGALAAVASGLHVVNVGDASSTDGPALDVLGLTAAESQEYRAAGARATTDLDVVLSRYHVTAAVPLTRGSTWKERRSETAIVEALVGGNGLDVRLGRRALRLRFGDDPGTLPPSALPVGAASRRYLAVNRKLREAYWGEPRLGDWEDWQALATVQREGSCLGLSFFRLAFGRGQAAGPGGATIESVWLKDAELWVVDAVPVARLVRRVELVGALDLPLLAEERAEPGPSETGTGLPDLGVHEKQCDGALAFPVEELASGRRLPSYEREADEVRRLLLSGSEDAVEALMKDLIASGTRTRNGTYYASSLLDETCEHPRRRITLLPALDRWVAQRSGSSMAFTFRGAFYRALAWQTRGEGWSKNVRDKTWQGAEAHLERMRGDLERALALDPANPLAAAQMLNAGRLLDLGSDEFERYFGQATAAVPAFYQPYDSKLLYLMPKWGHAPSEQAMFHFARAARDCSPRGSTLPYLVVLAHREHASRLSDAFEAGPPPPPASVFKDAGRADARLGPRGAYYMQPDVWKEISDAFTRLMQEHPRSGRWPSRFARYARDTGRTDEGRRLHQLALERDPQDFEVVTEWARFLRYAEGKPDDALAQYEKAALLDPLSAEAWRPIGNIQFVAGRLREAEAAYLKALEDDPEDLNINENLTKLAVNLQNYEAAVEGYSRLADLDPDRAAEHYYGRCWAHLKLRLYELAVRDCTWAIDLKPRYKDAYVNRAYAYGKLGLFAERQRDKDMVAKLAARGEPE